LIVEFDGDYWHGNSKFFVLTPRMKKQCYLDRLWDKIAVEAGFNIKRVWESDVKTINLEDL